MRAGGRLVRGAVAAAVMALSGWSAAVAPAQESWVGAWATAPTSGRNIDLPAAGLVCPTGSGVTDRTVRNVVAPAVAGSRVRVRLTNVYGTTPLQVGAATLAESAGGGALVTGTRRALTFGGEPSVTIPAGQDAVSDPLNFDVRAYVPLAVSLYLPQSTGPAVMHGESQRTNYIAGGAGDFAAENEGAAFAANGTCWLWLRGLDVVAEPRVHGAVVAFGDSITDGQASTRDADQRWPDTLARRLAGRPGPTLSVLNAGISGNRLLGPATGGAVFGLGGLARLDYDALGQTGARAAIVLEGINDISGNASSAQLIAGYQSLIGRLHARGIPVIGATMTPFKGSKVYSAAREQARQQTNAWILTSAAFDGTVDFAAATADPNDPQALRPEYDSGDHLHLTDAGYAAMGDAVNVRGLLRLTGVDADFATATVGGTVPATLALSLDPPASFGAFAPGVARSYGATTTATVTSTAEAATLSIADPSPTATGHLVNGPFTLPQPLRASATSPVATGYSAAAVANSSPLLDYLAPISNDTVTLRFEQAIGASDALRTGTYAKTLVLTLSTTTP